VKNSAMCRLIGIVASEPTEFGLVLREAPRCLATLSREHPDGWGIAVFAGETSAWELARGTERAADDGRFHEIATRSRGNVLVAHVRQKTVGPTRLENTHPFERDGWVFAHNGTVKDVDVLRSGASPRRRGEITGDTDSELLFAFLLSKLDERGLSRLGDEASRAAANDALLEVTRVLRERNVGAFNFVLSDGATTFAHRFGRSLYLLERVPGDPVRELRDVSESATIMTKWTARRHAVFVASEKITSEPWEELPEGALLRIDRAPVPRVVSAAPGRAA
jgi:glutamine amidotransferase